MFLDGFEGLENHWNILFGWSSGLGRRPDTSGHEYYNSRIPADEEETEEEDYEEDEDEDEDED